jgi:hypothetical protein
LMEMLELSRLPHSFLSEHVRESGLVSKDRLWQLFDQVLKGAKQARPVDKSARLRCVAIVSGHPEDGDAFEHIWDYCVCGTGAHARLAVVDCGQCCVYVFSVEEMKFLWKVGREGRGPGEFIKPESAVFDGRGHLWVSDIVLKTIQVFDGQGSFVRCIGEGGFDAGEFSMPWKMSLSAQGDVVVCDLVNDCVAMFGQDGRFLRMLPAAHDQHDVEFHGITIPFTSADGNIIVQDCSCVRLFSSEGLFLKEVKPPELGSDEHWCPYPYNLCTGPQGELISVDDYEDSWKVCVRDADCGLLWSAEDPQLGCSKIKMDYKGRLFCKPRNNKIEVWEVEFHDAS